MADNGSPTPDASSARRRRWPWILLGSALAFVLLVRALLPLAVERTVAWGSRRYLGLPARVVNVDFSLLGGGVTIDGLTVGPRPDGVTPLEAAWDPPILNPRNAILHWNRVAVRFSWRALFQHTIHLTDVEVDAPETRVTRETDGHIDPMRHAHPTVPPAATAPAASPPTAAPASPPPTPWKIRIDRFTLRRPQIDVVDAASGADLIRFSLDVFGLQQVALQGDNLSLGGVSISGPVLRVRRDLLFGQRPSAPAPPPASAAAGPAAPPGSPAPAYRIDHIDVERAEFVWVTDAGPVQVALSVHASDVSAQPGQRFPIDLALEIEKGRIGIRGEAGIVPPAYAGSLTWNGLPFPPLALATAPDLAHWLKSCQSSGDLKVDVDLGAKDHPDVTLSGQIAVDDLSISDPAGKEVALAWKRLEIAIHQIAVTLPQEEGAPVATKVALDRVTLVDPKVLYTRPSPALDTLVAGKPAAAKGAEPPTAEAAAPPSGGQADHAAPSPVELSLASLDVRGGNLELVDQTVKPQARTRIRGLSISARDLRFPSLAAAALKIRADLPEQAPLAVDGGIRPGRSNFTIDLKRLDLPAFDPYASAAGATLDHGQASLQTTVRMRGDRIEADSELLLSKLGVSLRDPDSFQRRFGVPIDVALALLRDPAGNIHLSIPVEMQGKGARVALGTVVASALRQALVGALSAPLKMVGAGLSGLRGSAGGGLSVEPLAAVPGSAEIAQDQSGRLDGIAKLLASRPTLGLVLRGRTGPADKPAVAERLLAERMQAGQAFPDVQGAGFFARRRLRQALEKRASGKAAELSPEDEVLYERMIAGVPVPEERLRALARQRADAVRALLLARRGVAPSQVTAGEPAPPGPPAVVLALAAR